MASWWWTSRRTSSGQPGGKVARLDARAQHRVHRFTTKATGGHGTLGPSAPHPISPSGAESRLSSLYTPRHYYRRLKRTAGCATLESFSHPAYPAIEGDSTRSSIAAVYRRPEGRQRARRSRSSPAGLRGSALRTGPSALIGSGSARVGSGAHRPDRDHLAGSSQTSAGSTSFSFG
jgi:hypothetical protein